MTGIKRLTPPQSRKVNSLIKKECCNCDNGHCILLDDGEECVCPQLISYSLLCKWFQTAVLPLDKLLYAELFKTEDEIVKKHTPIKSLLIDWLIIFGTYLFIRIFFALFGLHQNIVLLGCCLAILPYLFGALYLQKSHKQCQLWLAALAILIPSVVEKAAIYLFGAYLYNLRPINVVGVMEAIKSNAPYTNFIKNQSAQNLINLSYFNWTYILCSIAISVLVILLLHKTKQKSNKG